MKTHRSCQGTAKTLVAAIDSCSNGPDSQSSRWEQTNRRRPCQPLNRWNSGRIDAEYSPAHRQVELASLELRWPLPLAACRAGGVDARRIVTPAILSVPPARKQVKREVRQPSTLSTASICVPLVLPDENLQLLVHRGNCFNRWWLSILASRRGCPPVVVSSGDFVLVAVATRHHWWSYLERLADKWLQTTGQRGRGEVSSLPSDGRERV
eukprot:scaffold3605_cov430-Prasinococcus_capsulatus_cf.AAC.10